MNCWNMFRPVAKKSHPAMTSQPGWTLPCYAQWVPQRRNWNLSFVQDVMIEVMRNWMSFVWPGAGKYLAIVKILPYEYPYVPKVSTV